jgi:hypothetical protein
MTGKRSVRAELDTLIGRLLDEANGSASWRQAVRDLVEACRVEAYERGYQNALIDSGHTTSGSVMDQLKAAARAARVVEVKRQARKSKRGK